MFSDTITIWWFITKQLFPRMHPTSILRVSLRWTPAGKRKIGGRKETWRKLVEKEMKDKDCLDVGTNPTLVPRPRHEELLWWPYVFPALGGQSKFFANVYGYCFQEHLYSSSLLKFYHCRHRVCFYILEMQMFKFQQSFSNPFFKGEHDSGHVTLYRLLVLGKCIEICICCWMSLFWCFHII